MSHPYDKHREKHPGKARVSKVYGHFARGGKVKGGKTNINIIVAPGKGSDNAPPPMAGPPPMPPLPPKPPMGGPPMPGGPGAMPPGLGMKRGGGVPSGIANSENLKKWADRASSNSRYERGGKVPMKAGADSGPGRLQKIKAYAHKARKK